jgi:hypothetical protein
MSRNGDHLDLIRPSVRRLFFHARLLTSLPRARHHLHLMNDVTQFLSALGQGDPHAASRLLPLVYGELRKLAAQRMAHEQPGQTLQSPALVHQAYLRRVRTTANSRDLTPPEAPLSESTRAKRHIVLDALPGLAVHS